MCRPVLKILTLFQTKIYDFPYPISDLALNAKKWYPYIPTWLIYGSTPFPPPPPRGGLSRRMCLLLIANFDSVLWLATDPIYFGTKYDKPQTLRQHNTAMSSVISSPGGRISCQTSTCQKTSWAVRRVEEKKNNEVKFLSLPADILRGSNQQNKV